ncbi:Murein DD-endopeptidase MepM and murein hydrolase activator NlpD, contain LysM domain [Meinhardsimonia xiamenensis]|jgi:murein DD-endopeptidase MepM/ murein hydrolase activator NlpD|uniref:Murein DD-endopeptidase MepM and murein hydrolase activator NlpD, contain LysM domain n=1 Tax=Meinhardsimonia xiamenensis TaxID=990712 RepID=A0A1G9AKC5_9RHOB|nr:LysM peptidoglycan-binding domain-containing protein [Meinhardsimonia xiamenensis]PRX35343.1 murein DD-endopeptidase MepM/ murein hydrolase activator NlpD [Meinhardsimonia xiamenensis]SDK27809.1 Murein DD-endopeptidase MepM and murein hydrolase activator NlpD, contain LysM domain [Meinhardsimonia xiamenensis]
MPEFSGTSSRLAAALIATAALAGCSGLDLDLRDVAGQPLDTSAAVEQASAPRPAPDARGVISYPQFDVAIARRGDTVASLAARIGVDARALAENNGLTPEASLRAGEVLVLPASARRGGSASAGGVDITTLAGNAIERAESAQASAAATPVQEGPAPVRHKVVRGDTAYSIARLYGVSVRALAEWNGLDADMTVREGQILLIPVPAEDVAAAKPEPAEARPTAPGEGSPTPLPPSAAKPLPEDDTKVTKETATPKPAAMAEERTETSTSRLVMPVQGSIIRPYKKGVNEGIDIAAAPGTPVKAAGSGVVAAITRDTDQVPILVIRHSGNLLTVYANIDDITVKKGDSVNRGQVIAKVRAGDPSFLHFEVREGFDSVDPVEYLN